VDDGRNWHSAKTVEEGTGAYSDLTLLPDGTTLCFYERKDALTVARLTSEWLNQSDAATAPASNPVTNGGSSR
jgi:sialidase-1